MNTCYAQLEILFDPNILYAEMQYFKTILATILYAIISATAAVPSFPNTIDGMTLHW